MGCPWSWWRARQRNVGGGGGGAQRFSTMSGGPVGDQQLIIPSVLPSEHPFGSHALSSVLLYYCSEEENRSTEQTFSFPFLLSDLDWWCNEIEMDHGPLFRFRGGNQTLHYIFFPRVREAAKKIQVPFLVARPLGP